MSPHMLTSIAYYVIGIVLIEAALRVWWTDPVNRPFLFGRYVTEDGMKLVLRHWPMVFLFGAFIFACAVEHGLDAHHVTDVQEYAAWIEAAISWATAAMVAIIRWRAWKR